MFRITDFIQVPKEFVEPPLLQPDIDFQRVIRGRSPDFNPTSGNVSPFMLHLQIPPTFVEVEWFRDRRVEDTKQSNSPE